MGSSYRHLRLFLIACGAVLMCCGLVSVVLAYSPDQAEAGAKIYTDRCSTCHGDVGQGLTDEFRATWASGDRNCWIPACHGGSPPKPDGFSLPRVVPALAGPGTLTRFPSALALHAFIRAKMPMQEPGVLSDDGYWALTAFLLRVNGVSADGKPLDSNTAAFAAVPRSGQPVPKPNRAVQTTNKMPLQARERNVPARPAPSRTVEAASGEVGAGQASGGFAAQTGSNARAPAGEPAGLSTPFMPTVWTLVLTLGLGLVAFLLRRTTPAP